MSLKRVCIVTAVLVATLFVLSNLISPLQTAHSAAQANTTLLYDSSLGTTLGQQNFSYVALNPDNANPFNVQASQSYSTPVTVLNSHNQLGDYAGNTVTPSAMPTLTRSAGFQLSLDLRLVTETHNNNDRAGFSLILLSEDLYGVELAFWTDEIWVQEGNGLSPFTHAEGAAYDTTAALTTYELTMIGNTYLLTANGVPLLSGPLRQYTDWQPPAVLLPDPYEVPNQLFLGDDTASSGAEVWLGNVRITTDIAPTVSVAETAVTLPETLTQTTFTVQLSVSSPLTTTVQYGLSGDTASPGQDFVDDSGTLTFSPGSLSQTITLTLLPDALPEPDETFRLQLSNVENGVLGVDTAVFTIQDDDVGYTLFLPEVVKP
ncbi:MAG: hypothetical protein H6652_20185 [Ardenticatenaceae bacterium]|nr:hypothetical protein [Ardenticatenaceae bacterium]MCB8948451.1 hypothetical protein [Ardenticatenaceae bacterium]